MYYISERQMIQEIQFICIVAREWHNLLVRKEPFPCCDSGSYSHGCWLCATCSLGQFNLQCLNLHSQLSDFKSLMHIFQYVCHQQCIFWGKEALLLQFPFLAFQLEMKVNSKLKILHLSIFTQVSVSGCLSSHCNQ